MKPPILKANAAVAVAAAVGFTALALSVERGTTGKFDLATRSAVHANSPAVLTPLMQAVTQLGGGWFLWPLGALIFIALIRQSRRRDAAFFAVTILGAEILNESLKLIFHRPRPDPFFGYPLPDTYSFPSGHSFLSCCFYLTLAGLWIRPEWPRARKTAVLCAAVVLVLLIGFSRVYLGVHYPTDVLAGYLGAISWMAITSAAHERWWGSERP